MLRERKRDIGYYRFEHYVASVHSRRGYIPLPGGDVYAAENLLSNRFARAYRLSPDESTDRTSRFLMGRQLSIEEESCFDSVSFDWW